MTQSVEAVVTPQVSLFMAGFLQRSLENRMDHWPVPHESEVGLVIFWVLDQVWSESELGFRSGSGSEITST